MDFNNLFNLSSEMMQKLNAKMAVLDETAGVSSNGFQACMSCKGGSCTVGFGGD